MGVKQRPVDSIGSLNDERVLCVFLCCREEKIKTEEIRILGGKETVPNIRELLGNTKGVPPGTSPRCSAWNLAGKVP